MHCIEVPGRQTSDLIALGALWLDKPFTGTFVHQLSQADFLLDKVELRKNNQEVLLDTILLPVGGRWSAWE